MLLYSNQFLPFLYGMLRSHGLKCHALTDSIPHSLGDRRSLSLTIRQITDEATFFEPKHPSEITLDEVGIDQEQMDLAIKRVKAARENKEEMLVVSDYDA